jgi:hypothetical protein
VTTANFVFLRRRIFHLMCETVTVKIFSLIPFCMKNWKKLDESWNAILATDEFLPLNENRKKG